MFSCRIFRMVCTKIGCKEKVCHFRTPSPKCITYIFKMYVSYYYQWNGTLYSIVVQRQLPTKNTAEIKKNEMQRVQKNYPVT